MAIRTYGWRRDLPDKRDLTHAPRLAASEPVPDFYSAKDNLPNAWNQGRLGSCTAFALGGCIVHELVQTGVNPYDFTPAFLQPYYLARELEGTTQVDVGAYIRDICKVGARWGITRDALWPYNIDRFAVRPNKAALKDALNTRISSYARVPQNLYSLLRTLAGGDTIICGISVYESFESREVEDTGIVPIPKPSEDLLGGHAIQLVGYDLANEEFLFRNSYSVFWGVDGYGRLPFEYVTDPDLAADFWVIRAVTSDRA